MVEIDGSDAEEEDGTRRAYYDDLARGAIHDLLEREQAAIWTEIESKLAERPQQGAPRGINPHHLTNGRRRLVADGVIEEITASTYGRRVVTVLALRNRHGRQDAFRTAVRRKRALEGRYLGWTESSTRRPNLIGDGGERVVLQSLRATNAGYGLVNPKHGEVAVLFGEPVPGGPLDNAAHIALDTGDDLRGLTTIVEVKNLRKWIYPPAASLFQLLDKSARLQIAHPKRRFLPVLVARSIHYTTFRMAKHLGFFLIQFDARAQPILPNWTVTGEQVREVREELGYVLALTDKAMPGVTARFDSTIPRVGLQMAERWAGMAPDLAPHFGALRRTSLSGQGRELAMDHLYRAAVTITEPGPRGAWRTVSDAKH